MAAYVDQPTGIDHKQETVEMVARIIALAGLGTSNGSTRTAPPNDNWDPEEWRRRVMECIPTEAEDRCRLTALAILDALLRQQLASA
jgi:hypothetical protein